jgi:CBS domain containing-hemolysin-like protein
VSEVWVTAAKLLAVVALVLANGFFVAAEFSLVSIRRTRVDEMVEQGVLGARAVKSVLTHLDTYIAATQLGVTLCSLALGWLGEPTVGHLMEEIFGHAPAGPVIAVIVAFTIITAVDIVVGELTPKTVALQHPERIALITVQPLMVFQLIFHPFIVMLSAAGRGLLRLLGLKPPSGHELVHSADELKMLVEASGRAGVLEDSERTIINRAFDFADFATSEVMVPRTEVVAVAADTPGPGLLDFAEEQGFSSYPVYDVSLYQPLGIMHVKDLLGAIRDGSLDRITARDLVREALAVPDTLPVDDLLDRMRQGNVRMALVIDEYGGTAGVVTMENLVERLFGPLRDEFEQGTLPDILRRPDGTATVNGLVNIGDVNDVFGLELDDTDFNTIGGYVMGRLDRVPEVGDSIDEDGYRMRVEAMDGHRVDRVLLTPRQAGDADAAEQSA